MAHTNQTFFPLPTANQAVNIARANSARGGMTIVNPNTNAALPGFNAVLLVFFGGALDPLYGVPLQPGEKWVMDFITPEDVLWCQSTTANARVVLLESNK